LIIVTKDKILKYNLQNGKVSGQADLELGADIRQVVAAK
jgi:hypothetical protein